jgi:hypothetical protein
VEFLIQVQEYKWLQYLISQWCDWDPANTVRKMNKINAQRNCNN